MFSSRECLAEKDLHELEWGTEMDEIDEIDDVELQYAMATMEIPRSRLLGTCGRGPLALAQQRNMDAY